MITIEWHNGEVPSKLQTRQVYGVIFTKDGRMLLKVENKFTKKVYSLAGGTPEEFDQDRIETLRRELKEEVNTEIEDKVLLVGYQTISGDGDLPDYAQVRMTAMIKKIGPRQPDPDNGKTYERILTSPSRAIELLKWHDGDKLINEACRIAKKEFCISFDCLQEENV